MSTNLHNLAHGHFATLIGSVFVTSNGFIYVRLPGLICRPALAELFFLAQWPPDFGLRARARRGDADRRGRVGGGHPVRLVADFGGACQRRRDELGAMAVLGALTIAIPARWRPGWIGWWLAVALLAVFAGDRFTNAGHLVALMIGMSLSARFRVVVRWTPMRCVLLAIGAAFVYLVLANELSLVIAPIAGLLGAVIVQGRHTAGVAVGAPVTGGRLGRIRV